MTWHSSTKGNFFAASQHSTSQDGLLDKVPAQYAQSSAVRYWAQVDSSQAVSSLAAWRSIPPERVETSISSATLTAEPVASIKLQHEVQDRPNTKQISPGPHALQQPLGPTLDRLAAENLPPNWRYPPANISAASPIVRCLTLYFVRSKGLSFAVSIKAVVAIVLSQITPMAIDHSKNKLQEASLELRRSKQKYDHSS